MKTASVFDNCYHANAGTNMKSGATTRISYMIAVGKPKYFVRASIIMRYTYNMEKIDVLYFVHKYEHRTMYDTRTRITKVGNPNHHATIRNHALRTSDRIL